MMAVSDKNTEYTDDVTIFFVFFGMRKILLTLIFLTAFMGRDRSQDYAIGYATTESLNG